MHRVSVRVDADLYRLLSKRAAGAELSLSDFVRAVLRQASEPQARYIFSSQDEILATCIQILSIVATSTALTSPKALEQGMADARAILRERGLLGEVTPS